ncbi:hypothetical protein H0G86_006710 [Trichoderma simmonsii]|uniref:Peptidase C14 caspase domain-containing protein n=1 Tax=Trichoderma simmonsii TaxID=1491479 RepID=A0A8G0PGE5_9HYPO|nr:hypothetical protein H0G86_006710 [Trichoderma simmonsii]
MPKRYALLVGIDLYLNDGSRKLPDGRELSLNDLHGCVNDVEAMREFLQSQYEFNDISILTSSFPSTTNDETTKPPEPPDRWPTFSNIKREFETIYEKANAGDFFFFHYSGHGAQLTRVKKSPKKRFKDPSLLMVDFCYGQPAIRGWQLNQWLKKLNKKDIQIVVTLDSCHSGGSWRVGDPSFRTPVDWSSISIPNLPIDDQATTQEDITDLPFRSTDLEISWSMNPEGFTLMAACESNEKAAEMVINGKVRGAFTNELLCYLTQSNISVTYRMIRDRLTRQLNDQTPVVYGRDRLLFFSNLELFFSTPLVVRVTDDRVIFPVGRAHGIYPESEFMVFPPNSAITLSIEEVDDFECSTAASDELIQLLQHHHHTVIPSRWSLGEEILHVIVDPNFGLEFQQLLYKSLQTRIVSHIKVIEYAKSSQNNTMLRLQKWGDDVQVWEPKSSFGHGGLIRPLRLRGNDLEVLAAETAGALAHIARFRQIVNLTESSSELRPFEMSIKPINGATDKTPYPLNQKFKFEFENKGKDELHLTVIVLSPEFHIAQLYPSRDSPETVAGGKRRSFRFSMKLPTGPQWVEATLERHSRRDLVRILVTRGEKVSWKNLELPNIWDINQVGPCRQVPPERDAVLEADSDLWVQDEEIVTGSKT